MTAAANNRPGGSKPVQQAGAPLITLRLRTRWGLRRRANPGPPLTASSPRSGTSRTTEGSAASSARAATATSSTPSSAGAGYNTHVVFKWLRLLLARIMAVILNVVRPPANRRDHAHHLIPRSAQCRRPYAVPPGRGGSGERKPESPVLLGTWLRENTLDGAPLIRLGYAVTELDVAKLRCG